MNWLQQETSRKLEIKFFFRKLFQQPENIIFIFSEIKSRVRKWLIVVYI